jgi:geranylgeranyl diphosphate synthase type I
MPAAEPEWVLDQVHDVMVPRLRAAVDRLPHSVRDVVAHHFGWAERPAGSPGKLVRPALSLLCSAAVGGTWGQARDAAVAVELVHNSALLHGDVMEGALVRRHRETAWWRYGMPRAILAGDALAVLGMELLAGRPAAASILGEALREMIHGQCQDIGLADRDTITVEECLSVAGVRTAALLRCACELGALQGGGRPAQVLALKRFGWHLGLAFQLTDDLLGIWGDPRATGRSARADLRAGKKTLPVVAALCAGGPSAAELASRYLRPEPLDDDDLIQVAALVEHAGGRRWARAEAHRQCRTALACLDAAQPVEDAYDALAALATALAGRDAAQPG